MEVCSTTGARTVATPGPCRARTRPIIAANAGAVWCHGSMLQPSKYRDAGMAMPAEMICGTGRPAGADTSVGRDIDGKLMRHANNACAQATAVLSLRIRVWGWVWLRDLYASDSRMIEVRKRRGSWGPIGPVLCTCYCRACGPRTRRVQVRHSLTKGPSGLSTRALNPTPRAPALGLASADNPTSQSTISSESVPQNRL